MYFNSLRKRLEKEINSRRFARIEKSQRIQRRQIKLQRHRDEITFDRSNSLVRAQSGASDILRELFFESTIDIYAREKIVRDQRVRIGEGA